MHIIIGRFLFPIFLLNKTVVPNIGRSAWLLAWGHNGFISLWVTLLPF